MDTIFKLHVIVFIKKNKLSYNTHKDQKYSLIKRNIYLTPTCLFINCNNIMINKKYILMFKI